MRLTRSTNKHIWVLCGGPSTEYEVSLSSGRCVCEQIEARGRIVTPVIVTRQGQWIISKQKITIDQPRDWIENFFNASGEEWNQGGISLPQALQQMLDERVDCVFLAFHGQYGEDGAIQGFLQTAGIPYTGSGILASSLAFNKSASLDIFAKAGLPVANSVLCTRKNPFPAGLSELKYPLFTKPVCGGSSLGVSLVKSPDNLQAGIMHALENDERALAEEKIEGVEVSCGILDIIKDNTCITQALPPTLISPLESEFFDYDAKYTPGKSNDVTPAPLPQPLIERLQRTALAAHKALCCEGMSRTDMIVMKDADAVPFMLETQTLPGMTPTSLIPQQCAAAGITFAHFIDLLIEHALWRSSNTGRYNG